MIKARRLFLLPAVSFMILSPLMPIGAGIIIWLLIVAGWYSRNHNDIEMYFRGIKYRPGEYSRKDKILSQIDSPAETQFTQAEELT